MTVLTAAQSAMIRLVGQKPTTIFSSQNKMEMEIADLSTEVAVDIMKSNDWRALTKFQTLTGDGTITAFDLPADYDRMALAEDVTDPNNWFWGYSQAQSLTDWMQITSSGFFGITPGWWIILEGQMHFAPAPSDGNQAKFAYISKNIGRDATLAPIAAFTSDDDTFVLSERLLTLGLIWRWKAQKGIEYAEDLANFEKALSENAGRDKGATVIRKGAPYRSLNTRTAWPWALG